VLRCSRCGSEKGLRESKGDGEAIRLHHGSEACFLKSSQGVTVIEIGKIKITSSKIEIVNGKVEITNIKIEIDNFELKLTIPKIQIHNTKHSSSSRASRPEPKAPGNPEGEEEKK
jgi:hypothetical protein